MKDYTKNPSMTAIDKFITKKRKKTDYERIEDLEALCRGYELRFELYDDILKKLKQQTTLFNKIKNALWKLKSYLRHSRTNMD